MNYLEFSKKVKAKHPQYGDMDDRELAEKLTKKFPAQYSDVTFDDNPSLMGMAGEAVKNLAAVPGQVLTAPTDPAFQQKAAPWLPAVGGVVGAALGPVGVAAGTGLGEIARQAYQVAEQDPAAPRTPWEAAKGAMTQTALAGVPEASAIFKAVPGAASYGERATQYAGKKVYDAAVDQGRRALGFTKRYLNKKAGGLAKANDVTRTMLDEGVIQPFSGAGGIKTRIDALNESSGKGVAQTVKALHDTGQKSLNTNEVIRDVYAQLSPRYQGGAYDEEKKIFDEVVGTIRAHGDGPIDFNSAQDLKEKLQKLGQFQVGGDSVKAEKYRRASGIARKALDDAIERGLKEGGFPADAMAQFQRNKRAYGATEEATEGITNRISSEQGNRIVSLTDFLTAIPTAVAGTAHGGAGLGLAAAATVGLGKRAVERYGASTSAWALKKTSDLIAANGEAINFARRALITKLITKEGTTE